MDVTRTDLCDQSAVDLVSAIASGYISPVDLVESCISRIQARNPKINAVVTDNFEEARCVAMSAARGVDASPSLGPLHGLPVFVKDLTHTKGLRTTFGSLAFEKNIPDFDEIIVSRLKSAGAIILGKTNTPEFGAGANTNNRLFGATVNPHDTTLTAGGSSGGSAAAVASGMVPFATGSDLGGSLRIPAAFCGVVGFRPSPGEIPSASNTLGFSPLWTDGPIARTVADAALMFNAVRGFDHIDPRAYRSVPVRDNNEFDDLSTIRIGFSSDLGFAPIDPLIRDVFESGKKKLSRVFANTTDIDVDLSSADEIFLVLRGEELLAALGGIVEKYGDTIGGNVRSGVAEAAYFSFQDRAAAGRLHTEFYKSFQRMFNEIDVLICPTAGVSPFSVCEDHPSNVGGHLMEKYYSWYAMTWALSLASSPIISLPLGTDQIGMPFGVQLVGPRGCDGQLLRIGQFLENKLKALGSDC